MDKWLRIALGMFIIAFGANSYAPMLLAYKMEAGLSESTVTFLLAAYILGLVPALLIGGKLSDRVGRRALMRPALVISALSSLIILAGGFGHTWLIGLGRFIGGIAIGFVMSSGAAWLREISDAPAAVSAKRATLASTGGFSGGPLVAGLLAQFAPFPLILPWAFHAIATVIVAFLVWNLPEVPVAGTIKGRMLPSIAFSSRFLWSVAAWAPWVFGCASTAFAILVSLTNQHFEHKIAYAGVIACVTMAIGMLVQPIVPRLGKGFVPPAVIGMGFAFLGMVFSYIIVRTDNPMWVAPAVLCLGTAYGIMMVSGLREVQLMAPAHELGSLIGIYYSMTYLGFFVPFVVSLFAPRFGYDTVFLIGMAVIALSVYPVTRVIRKYAPETES
ncbi:Major Facilitator Superfamily protein [Corynebacterium kalinowskii]|uniref:Major Facilitator Superfamily protein n=1 Tax=Corynebacterium kalinowskii TaxID=2675216 RepID=A0A6B8VD93_9CORY|nr:MFS transporter [Corynebacterium kalinowskii]QGU03182.1 Major Facilitator Superfamily protein [Corynebacterium kalinowskii]